MLFKNMSKAEQLPNVNTITRISQGTSFKGEIQSAYDIRIDGVFEGDIVAEGKVVLGETARVNGTISCIDLDLWGTAEGEFTVKGILSLHDKCRMTGNVHTRKLYVELGSTFNGNCAMMEEKGDANPRGKAEEKAVEQKK